MDWGRVQFQNDAPRCRYSDCRDFRQAEDITIRVHAEEKTGAFKPIYGYFGYDEPNFTYVANGRKLVGELAALGSAPVYIRTHFMLATGDGKAGFKFGSTNAYTGDDWTYR